MTGIVFSDSELEAIAATDSLDPSIFRKVTEEMARRRHSIPQDWREAANEFARTKGVTLCQPRGLSAKTCVRATTADSLLSQLGLATELGL